MPDPLVTTIGFDALGVAVLVDRRRRHVFLMDHEANHLGAFQVTRGYFCWFGIDDAFPPVEVVEVVHSMIGGKRVTSP